jgi:hypothetical protein
VSTERPDPASTPPPADFGPEFLHWLQQATERSWAVIDEPTVADLGARWRRGTRWTGGLEDATIAAVEKRYGVQFPPDYRLFLQTLHSTTPWRLGGTYDGTNNVVEYEAPGFYDWLNDEPQIREAMRRVAGTMHELPFDKQAWQTMWIHQDPKPALLPIFGHRYVVADSSQWILSIVDYDAIIFRDNLRDYLLTELDL